MAKKYFVIGLRKIRTKEEYKNKILGHNHRNRKYVKNPHSNIDWSRTHRNIVLQDLKYKSANELIESGNSKRAKGRRKLKAGSAFAFEIIVDCSPDPTWKENDYINYLKDAYEFFKERFQGQELVSAVIHMDESKPHLHLTFSYFNEELGRWNQRNLMKEKKTDLNKILDDFKEAVGKKYGLERGEGKEIKEELKKEFLSVETKRELLERIEKLPKTDKKIIRENIRLREENARLRKEKEELEQRLKELQEKAKEIEALKQENKTLKEENEQLKKQKIILVKSYHRALEIAAEERAKRYRKQVDREFLREMIDKQIQRDL